MGPRWALGDQKQLVELDLSNFPIKVGPMVDNFLGHLILRRFTLVLVQDNLD